MTIHAVGAMGDRKFALKRVEGLAWGLFFVWMGVVLLEELGWGIGLLGVGILIFAGQIARRWVAESFETFWLMVGALFVLGGAWTLLGVRVSLLPIVFILAGAALLVSAIVAKPKNG